MFSLNFLVLAFASLPPCEGSAAEIPILLQGWDEHKASWLTSELGAWFSVRDRSLCSAREGETTRLTITASELDATVRFEDNGGSLTRTIQKSATSISTPTDLFRYEVATAAEELVHATWERPSVSAVALAIRADVLRLNNGLIFIGGGVGVRWSMTPSWHAELGIFGAGAPRVMLPAGARLSAAVLQGNLSLAWLPVQLGIVRMGPRASVQAGALRLEVTPVGGTPVTGATPWISFLGGASVGIETRRVVFNLYGEFGSVVVGGRVLADGVPVWSARGLLISLGLQAGIRW